jgi:hypothetical protein
MEEASKPAPGREEARATRRGHRDAMLKRAEAHLYAEGGIKAFKAKRKAAASAQRARQWEGE